MSQCPVPVYFKSADNTGFPAPRSRLFVGGTYRFSNSEFLFLLSFGASVESSSNAQSVGVNTAENSLQPMAD
jgi:hypothetical protein